MDKIGVNFVWLFAQFFNCLLLLLTGGGLIFLFVWLVRRPQAAAVRESPLDIVKLRYAKGEITQEQYAQLKKDLE